MPCARCLRRPRHTPAAQSDPLIDGTSNPPDEREARRQPASDRVGVRSEVLLWHCRNLVTTTSALKSNPSDGRGAGHSYYPPFFLFFSPAARHPRAFCCPPPLPFHTVERRRGVGVRPDAREVFIFSLATRRMPETRFRRLHSHFLPSSWRACHPRQPVGLARPIGRYRRGRRHLCRRLPQRHERHLPGPLLRQQLTCAVHRVDRPEYAPVILPLVSSRGAGTGFRNVSGPHRSFR